MLDHRLTPSQSTPGSTYYLNRHISYSTLGGSLLIDHLLEGIRATTADGIWPTTTGILSTTATPTAEAKEGERLLRGLVCSIHHSSCHRNHLLTTINSIAALCCCFVCEEGCECCAGRQHLRQTPIICSPLLSRLLRVCGRLLLNNSRTCMNRSGF